MPAGAAMLPDDWRSGSFVGRVLTAAGPTPVLLHAGEIRDLSRVAPTVSQLLDLPDLIARAATAPRLGTPHELFAPDANATPDAGRLPLLAPIDLQCIKAAGVTFAVSAIERVIEERCRGQAELARELRTEIESSIGCDLRGLIPGSATAMALKESLLRQGLWSQYLEVAIGPDAEIFTKAPLLSAMGWGAPIGIRSDSQWNNPEPEVVLAVNSRHQVVGATLGNDVNLRDFEGRSALLLGKAKDNNGSCAIGPLIRLLDATFTLDDIRTATVELTISGADGYQLQGPLYDAGHQPLSGRTGGAGPERTRLSRRVCAIPGHVVCARAGP